ncbi:MAG: hypothetical protein QXO03_02595 [Thermoplasmatales archaeon]
MKILSEFLGTMKSFSLYEIQGLLRAYGGKLEEVNDNYLIFETDSAERIAKRVTFSRRLGIVVEDGLIDIGNRSFALREGKCHEAESKIPSIAAKIRGRVDLEHPDVTFVIYDCGKLIMTRNIFERKESSLLDSGYRVRPFNHPSSISPVIARAMINVASLRDNDLFVDPFAGTGTFLIEGYRMNVRGIGIDRDRRMVEGCNRNLAFFGFPETAVLGDFSHLLEAGNLSAIVTDPPYGRGARIFSDSRESLYARLFSLFADINMPKVFVLPSVELLDLAKQYMKVEIVENVRVHSSLTRLIVKA